MARRFRQLLSRYRALLGGAALVALVIGALLVPMPSALAIREWSASVGPALPLVFFAVHTVVTLAPIPRTVFTVSAGLLFGPALGIGVAAAATTVSAVLALLLVRKLGRDAVWRHLTHPAVRAVDARIARRGWLAVASLRLISFVPFCVINYVSGISSIKLAPYTVATAIAILPGTVGVVLLGDALTGQTSPGLLAISAVCVCIGLSGLVYDHVRPPAPVLPAAEEAAPRAR
jgi:uncharacterized membrane protein YdjX (TVP38/TMEM64 family)